MKAMGLLDLATLVSAVGSALIAGTFFAFSSFVMAALAKLPPPQGIAAMQSINVVVINPVFMLAFAGTAVLCAIVGATALIRWQEPGTGLVLAGAVLYVAGTFLVTMLFNVPRNDALAAVTPESAAAASFWVGYVSTWTVWNHVRAVAALAAMVAFIMALRLRG